MIEANRTVLRLCFGPTFGADNRPNLANYGAEIAWDGYFFECDLWAVIWLLISCFYGLIKWLFAVLIKDVVQGWIFYTEVLSNKCFLDKIKTQSMLVCVEFKLWTLANFLLEFGLEIRQRTK